MFSPSTAYIRDANGVFAAMASTPASPEVLAGLVNLALPGAYDLLQVDQDGTAIKAANLFANEPTNPDDGDAARYSQHRPVADPDRPGRRSQAADDRRELQ